MAHVPDDQALSALGKDVTSAIETLKVLTKTKASHLVGKSQTLPVEEVTLCAGIAFFKTTKAGFIISGVGGHGFLIKKLTSSSGGWSAPLPFDVKSLGVGISAGIGSSDNVLILDTDKNVHDFLHTQISLDSEVSVATGSVGREMHSSEFNASHPGDTFSNAMYSVAHGAMVDISFQGVKVSIKDHTLKKLYGPQATSSQVLDGGLPPPPIMEPLFAELQAMARAGSAPSNISHPTPAKKRHN